MQNKKNNFFIFYIFNIFLLLIILLLAVPISKFLKNLNLADNEFVSDQVIINPDAVSSKVIDRSVNIVFEAEVDNFLKWEFKSLENQIVLKIGETKIIKYVGKNLSNTEITSTADFKVSPDSLYPYIIKSECFCFIQQTLKPGEKASYNLIFYLDPELVNDPKTAKVEDVTMSYTFFSSDYYKQSNKREN